MCLKRYRVSATDVFMGVMQALMQSTLVLHKRSWAHVGMIKSMAGTSLTYQTPTSTAQPKAEMRVRVVFVYSSRPCPLHRGGAKTALHGEE